MGDILHPSSMGPPVPKIFKGGLHPGSTGPSVPKMLVSSDSVRPSVPKM